MSLAHYSLRQRRIEGAAIALFCLLAAWSLQRLAIPAWLLPLFALLGWLAADLFSGLVHCVFDRLGSVRTPIVGGAFIRPFREHHVDPQAMTRHDFVETNGASCLGCLPVLGATSLMPVEGGWAWLQCGLLFTALGVLFTNQCHKWAHMEDAATPRPVRWAQRCGLVLDPTQHRRHHTPPFRSHYCTASGWLNAPLDALLRAWR